MAHIANIFCLYICSISFTLLMYSICLYICSISFTLLMHSICLYICSISFTLLMHSICLYICSISFSSWTGIKYTVFIMHLYYNNVDTQCCANFDPSQLYFLTLFHRAKLLLLFRILLYESILSSLIPSHNILVFSLLLRFSEFD